MIATNKEEELLEIINSFEEGKHFNTIAEKIISDKRITGEEGLLLFEKASLGLVSNISQLYKRKKTW